MALWREDSSGTQHRLAPIYRDTGAGLVEIGIIKRELSDGTLQVVYHENNETTNLTATDESNCQKANTNPTVALSWDETGEGALVTHVEIWRCQQSCGWVDATEIATVGWHSGIDNGASGTGSYTDTTVDAGISYIYWVRIQTTDGTHEPQTGPAGVTTCTGPF